MRIPNIIHFICISPMKFELYHYIAIISAHTIHKPDKIYVYVDIEPVNNFYWEIVKDYIIIEKIVPPTIFRGIYIPQPQYQADIIRLEKLIERGGIYLDIDNLSLKPFTDLMDYHLVMGASPISTVERVDQLTHIDAISNSIILCVPNHPLLVEWYNIIDEYMNENYVWAYCAVCLPRDILLKNTDYQKITNILDWKTNFCPFDWLEHPFILDNSCNHRIGEINKLYTIVFYQTMVYDQYLKNINIHFFKNDNIFTQLFRKYVEFPVSKANILYNILNKLYKIGEWALLEEYSNIYTNSYNSIDNKKSSNVMFFIFYSQYKLNDRDKCIESYKKFMAVDDVDVDDELKDVAKYCFNKI